MHATRFHHELGLEEEMIELAYGVPEECSYKRQKQLISEMAKPNHLLTELTFGDRMHLP